MKFGEGSEAERGSVKGDYPPWSPLLSRMTGSLLLQFLYEAEDEVFCPARRGYHPIDHGFPQFGGGCSGILRAREVLFQSGGAPDGNSAADPDQFTRPHVQNFLVLELEKLLLDSHSRSFRLTGLNYRFPTSKPIGY